MRWPYILSLVALLGAGLLLFFNILCGASTGSVLGKWYWLEADTSGITGAKPMTRWTNYDSCGVTNGRNTDCSSKKAAYPMSPVSNFGTTTGVPSGLHSRKGSTYYLSKTGWAFLLIGLFFTMLGLVPVALSFCLPSLTALNVVTAFATMAALLFTALSACLVTAAYVKARNAFHNDGHSAKVGRTMFAFIWTSVFLLFLSSMLSGIGCFGNFASKKKERTRYSENHDSSSHETYGNTYEHEKAVEPTEKRGFFSRKKKAGYDEENLQDVGYAAGLGASGATSDITKQSTVGNQVSSDRGLGGGAAVGALGAAGGTALAAKSNNKSEVNAHGENLDEVAYAAGIGASGATSDYTNKSTDHSGKTGNSKYTTSGSGAVGTIDETRELNSKDFQGTTRPSKLNEVGYAAGIGASGATSNLSNSDRPGTKGYQSTGSNTSGYDKKLEKVAYSAGLGASGATSDVTKGTDHLGHQNTTKDQGISSSKRDNLDDVAYSAGLGSTGATSDATKVDHNKSTKTSGSDLDDVAYAAGLGASGATSNLTSGKYPKDSKLSDSQFSDASTAKNEPSDSSNRGLLATAAAALGFGGVAAADASSGKDHDRANTVDDDRTDVYGIADSSSKDFQKSKYAQPDYGRGATKAGANRVDDTQLKSSDSENKSTVLPVGGKNKHINQDGYGNRTEGYETGVPDNAAATAAATASQGTYQPVKDAPASSVSDTYKTTHGTGARKADLTTTSGYEPTEYYKGKTHDDFTKSSGNTLAAGSAVGGAGAGYGLSRNRNSNSSSVYEDRGKTSSSTKGTDLTSQQYGSGHNDTPTTGSYGASSGYTTGDPKYNSNKSRTSGSKSNQYQTQNEDLDDVAYAAGYGASGANSKYTTGDSSKYTTGGSTGERDSKPKLSGVGFAAGLGATGATSSYATGDAKKDQSRGTDNKSSTQYAQGEKLKDAEYATGLGASGKTSSYTTGGNTKSSQGRSDEGKYGSRKEEDLDKVAYAAGYGASGATSSYTTGDPKQSKADSTSKGGFLSAIGLGGASAKATDDTRKASDTTGSNVDSTGANANTTSHSKPYVGDDSYQSSQSKAQNTSNYTTSQGGSKYGSSGQTQSGATGSGSTTNADAAGTTFGAGRSGNTSSQQYSQGDTVTYGTGSSTYEGTIKNKNDVAVDISKNKNPIVEGVKGSGSKPTTANDSTYGTSTTSRNVSSGTGTAYADQKTSGSLVPGGFESSVTDVNDSNVNDPALNTTGQKSESLIEAALEKARSIM